jgi:xanthine dehydrogenase accessory factor
MKDLELWLFAVKHLRLKRNITLLVVAESSGSSPGRQGFKMVVAEDGTLFGSIGGGVMEIQLVQTSKLQILNSKLIEQVHRKNEPNSSGMICSGKQTILFLQLHQAHLPVVKKIIESLKNYSPAIIEITESALQAIDSSEFSSNYSFKKIDENSFIYQEQLRCKNKLFIIGGGHCALALSELMSKMDFYITVFDDRPNLNTLEKNKFANQVEIIDSYEKIAGLIDSDANTYVVVMTLGYKFDEIVIRQLFDKDFKYFGVLGSKAKMKTLLKTLEKDGFDKQKLAKIHTPIGLPINSHTPEEIAVSITAQIISVKNSPESSN